MDFTDHQNEASTSGNAPPQQAVNSGEEIPVKYTPVTGRISSAKKGVPIHTCEICRPPKSFTRAEHLRRHEFSHQIPAYACTFEDCERAFHRPDLLARHMNRHETQGEKPYKSGDSRSSRALSASDIVKAPSSYPGETYTDGGNGSYYANAPHLPMLGIPEEWNTQNLFYGQEISQWARPSGSSASKGQVSSLEMNTLSLEVDSTLPSELATPKIATNVSTPPFTVYGDSPPPVSSKRSATEVQLPENDPNSLACSDTDSVIWPDAYEDADSEHDLVVKKSEKVASKSIALLVDELLIADTPEDDLQGLQREEWIKLQNEIDRRRRRRKRHSSVAKRTFDQIIGSDTDEDDIDPHSIAFDIGPSPRRLRRKVDRRHGLVFDDPRPRIKERDEVIDPITTAELEELPFRMDGSFDVDPIEEEVNDELEHDIASENDEEKSRNTEQYHQYAGHQMKDEGSDEDSEGSAVESIKSIEDDIFSSVGSFSSTSTIASIRSTAIERLVGVFMQDEELSGLYGGAVMRLSKERFVRNQRRLLKKLFLDLRPLAQNQVQEQAIQILRGRAERTAISEQIWSVVNPKNPTRMADMDALLAQTPDKQFQLDRLLGPQPKQIRSDPVNLQLEVDDSTEGLRSDSVRSEIGVDEVKYSNMELATEFLVSGPAFKNYVTNMKVFLKLKYGPLSLHERVVDGDLIVVAKMLEDHFEDVAREEYDWLHELLEIGCQYDEMARLLIDGETGSPWILSDQSPEKGPMADEQIHQEHCVHTGGHQVETTLQLTSLDQPDGLKNIEISKSELRQIVGLAGILPVRNARPGVDCVEFGGKSNSIAWIRYLLAHDSHEGLSHKSKSKEIPMEATKDHTFLRGQLETQFAASCSSQLAYILEIVERCLCAIGILQRAGTCCDSFSILRLGRLRQNVELIRIPVAMVYRFRRLLVDVANSLDVPFPDLRGYEYSALIDVACTLIGRICGKVPGTPSSFFPDESEEALSLIALATQSLSLGVLSYSVAHIGPLHPEFLVDSLREIHLMGIPNTDSCHHIVAEQFEFNCMKDMLQDSVLVFRWSDDNGKSKLDLQTRYDLSATPIDIVDLWGPARFFADSLQPGFIFAMEIGGGTISRDINDHNKFHWSVGGAHYEQFSASFLSNEPITIGSTTTNCKCPLDERKSWQAAYPYIRNLGTRPPSWVLGEKHVGFQGGQYAVLQFNNTWLLRDGVTLKQQQLDSFNEISLAFLYSKCGLQISFCTGVARRVTLRQLLADTMVPFIESWAAKPEFWEQLKLDHCIVENFRTGDLEEWFNRLPASHRRCATDIVRTMLYALKDTGIDKNGEELVIAWVRKEDPFSCLRIRCEKTSFWARILADSEDCATFAYITPLCLESKTHKCQKLKVAPWHNVSDMLDTSVCEQLSNREIRTVTDAISHPCKLQHHVSYWIGKSGSNLIAKVWLDNGGMEPRLVIRQKIIPEKYRVRMPKGMVERLGRLREMQIGGVVARQVVVSADM